MALVVQIFSEGFELMMMHITHFTVLSAFNWQQKYALQKKFAHARTKVYGFELFRNNSRKLLFVVKNDIIILFLQIKS